MVCGKKGGKKRRIIIIIIIIIRNGAKTISLPTLFGRLNNIMLLIFIARMDFSEQYHIEDKA